MTESQEAIRGTTRAVSDAVRHGGEASAQASERGAEAGAETMRHLGDVAAKVTRRGSKAVAEGQQRLVESAAEQFEEAARSVARTVRDSAEDLQALFVVPTMPQREIQDLQEVIGGLVEGVMETNLRASRELFRLANPAAVVELQQRFMREYLEKLVEGSAILVRTARQAMDHTLQSLEHQVEQRRQSFGAQGASQGAFPGPFQGEERRPGRMTGRVADVMARDVRIANPEDSVQQAARLMREEDTGVLPVGQGDRLVGMVTDRDVALRLVAEGRDPARTKVREVMTPEVRYVFEDEDLRHVADNMAEQQVRRLPVVNRSKRLVGIVSLADVARKGRQPEAAGQALSGIAREGGQHSQTAAE